MTSRRYMVSDTSYRACSRCGEELTDPASREHGVGPVCRRKDTHLYAKTIPADFARATARALGIVPEMVHSEVREQFATFTSQLFTAVRRAEHDAEFRHWTGTDQREVIRSLDFMLSFTHPHSATRGMMIEVINSLGYVGLASVLSGNASTTTATLTFVNGRLNLVGAACTAGFRAMRGIQGVVLPRHRGSRLPYTAPATQAVAFCNVVRSHWPMFEGDMDAILRDAANYVATHPVSVAARRRLRCGHPVMRQNASTRLGMSMFSLTFPWRTDLDMFAFVTSLKDTVPYTSRTYVPSTRTWMISQSEWVRVEALVRRVFGGVCAFAGDTGPTR